MTSSAERLPKADQRAPAVGASILFGTLAALVLGALPLTRADGQAPFWLWATCAGSGALVLGPALVGARAIRGVDSLVVSAAAALILCAGPLMFLGRLIKTATHHRPLGAMTFAVIAAFVVLGAWVVVGRLTSIIRTSPHRGVRRGLLVALLVALLLSLVAALMMSAGLGAAAGAVLLDGTLMVVFLAAAWRFGLDSHFDRVPAALAWSLWAVVVAGGIVAAHRVDQSSVLLSLPFSVLVALVSA